MPVPVIEWSSGTDPYFFVASVTETNVFINTVNVTLDYGNTSDIIWNVTWINANGGGEGSPYINDSSSSNRIIYQTPTTMNGILTIQADSPYGLSNELSLVITGLDSTDYYYLTGVTNIQYTIAENISTNEAIASLTWDGVLEEGETWTVHLVALEINPGYEINIEVGVNAADIDLKFWYDRVITISKTSDPSVFGIVYIPAIVPEHTVPTDVSAAVYLYNPAYGIKINFKSVWLQSAEIMQASYNITAFYSLVGDDSNSAIVAYATLDADVFEIRFNADPLPVDEFYLVTFEIATDYDTSPRPTHVLTTILSATLQTLSLVYVGEHNYTSTGNYLRHTDDLLLQWTQDEGILEIEFESKIDESEWVPLITQTSGTNTILSIHNDHEYSTTSTTYLTCPDYLGTNYLDHSHFYKYSDGFGSDEYSDNTEDDWFPYRNLRTHTVQVRGRKIGNVEWTLTEEQVLPLRSIWYLPENHVWALQERPFGHGRWYHAYLTYTYTNDTYPPTQCPVFQYRDEVQRNISTSVAYVQDKTKKEVFTIDGGIVEPDLTNLQAGPQSWTASASSTYSTNVATNAISATVENAWSSTLIYDRYGKPTTNPAWWQCDFGSNTEIIGFEYKGNMQAANIRVYGSLTGDFTGEEILITPYQAIFSSTPDTYYFDNKYFYPTLDNYKTYIFSQEHNVRYLRLYFEGLDFEIQLDNPLNAILYDIRFYFGALIYNQDWIDIETQDWSLHWMSAMPREKLDGNAHTIQFKTIITNADTSVWTTAESGIMVLVLPLQKDIELPKTHLNINRIA